mgnify:CR=1 FL=1
MVMKLEGESLEVELGTRSYGIVIGRGLAANLASALHDLQREDRPLYGSIFSFNVPNSEGMEE